MSLGFHLETLLVVMENGIEKMVNILISIFLFMCVNWYHRAIIYGVIFKLDSLNLEKGKLVN